MSPTQLRGKAKRTRLGKVYYDPLNLNDIGQSILHFPCKTLVAQPEDGNLYCPTCRRRCGDDECIDLVEYDYL